MGTLNKVYKIVNPDFNTKTVQDSQDISGGTLYTSHSWYQRLVQGSSTRQSRYREYDNMDEDIEVARALDTIAEEMTQPNDKTGLQFDIVYDESTEHVSTATTSTIRSALQYWCKIQALQHRNFQIARNVVKYGDCFFRKQPEDRQNMKRWEFLHPKNVVAAVVDENDVTKIRAFQVRKGVKQAQANYGGVPVGGQEYETEFVDASDIVFFSLSDDMSEMAPFGESVLKPIFRTFKQKSLLEDAIVIYRISRAPERRVFYVDVGNMAPQRVKQYLEQIKNEIKQKKIPNAQGPDGSSQVESVYNPHSIQEDYFFAQRPNGKGSRVETLPGGQGMGDLSELEYFQAKMYRGLRVPTSYMQVTPQSGENPVFNDGRVGQAYIEELRFAEYCKRLQRNLDEVFDAEFKSFLRGIGVNVDPTMFHLELPEPTNLGLYKQQEADTAILSTLSNADSIPTLSKRFMLHRFGQLSQDEIRENERLKAEELGISPNDPEFFKKLYGEDEEEPGGVEGGLGDLGGGDISGDMSADDMDMEGGEEEGGAQSPEGPEGPGGGEGREAGGDDQVPL